MKHLVFVVALLAGCVDSVGTETSDEAAESEEVLCNCYDSSCSAAKVDQPCVDEETQPPGEHPTVTVTATRY